MTNGDNVDAERVTIGVNGGVAHVRLNRADKLNAVDPMMLRGLVSAGKRLMNDADVRAVVISGDGRAFCAGLDFEQFARIGAGPDDHGPKLLMSEDSIAGAKALGQQAALVWSQVPVPVIAAITGVAFGAGLQIALGADIRVVSPGAELSVMEVQWGLIPDMAGTQLLPELVGRDVAKELTFTGRKVTGSEALTLGLVTRLADDPVGSALGLAGEIARHDRKALAHSKALLDMAGRVPLHTGLDAEQAAMTELLSSQSVSEGVSARLQKLGRK